MRFRHHRANLIESLNTTREFKNKEELLNHLNFIYGTKGETVIDIRFDYAGFDERTNWNTYYVLIKKDSYLSDYGIVGMSDDEFV